jgi:hypothetical protein
MRYGARLGWNGQETAAKRDNDSTISIFFFFPFFFFFFVCSNCRDVFQTLRTSVECLGPIVSPTWVERVNWCVNPSGWWSGAGHAAGLKVRSLFRRSYPCNTCVKKKAAETIEFSLSLSLNQAEEDERVCIKDASRSKQTCYSERRKKKLN